MALYDQEVAWNNGTPNYQQLKIAVKLHIDQMMGNRNFRAQNDVVERRSVTKGHKGSKACVERKVGECFSVEGTWTMFTRRLMQFQSWRTCTKRLVHVDIVPTQLHGNAHSFVHAPQRIIRTFPVWEHHIGSRWKGVCVTCSSALISISLDMSLLNDPISRVPQVLSSPTCPTSRNSATSTSFCGGRNNPCASARWSGMSGRMAFQTQTQCSGQRPKRTIVLLHQTQKPRLTEVRGTSSKPGQEEALQYRLMRGVDSNKEAGPLCQRLVFFSKKKTA